LSNLSAGHWFHHKFASERIPTLAEVFELVHNAGIGINVEMKVDHRDCRRFKLVDRCCALIVRYHLQRFVLLSSFDYVLVRRARRVLPRVIAGVLYHPVRHIVRPPVSLTCALGAQYLVVNSGRLRKRLVRSSHRRGVLVGEYTVNTARRMERAIRYGVDAIFTDNPADMRTFQLT
jgi:glycerophosphoryl diester phosphodiesterase